MTRVFPSAVITILLVVAGRGGANAEMKNAILLISDGAGYNTHLSATYWTGAAEPYDTADFAEYPVATYRLRNGAGGLNNNDQDPYLVYDPARAWDTTPNADIGANGYPYYFEGYRWLRNTAPDSAATMSAMMTGEKVYGGGMNVNGFGKSLVTVAERAKAGGKMVGSISTVPYNHATGAAGGGAHNISRDNYLDLSYELFGAGVADLIGGAGNPGFTDNGIAVNQATLEGRLATGERFDAPLWNVMTSGSGVASRRTVDGRSFTVDGSDWELTTTKAAIQALADGSTTVTPGKKLALIPEVYTALQFYRSGPGGGFGATTNAFADPLNTNVPTLADMTNASLNFLDDDADGFFLAIEGGAVDWALHGNTIGRLIEEQIDFNNAVQAVIDYLDAGTNGNDWSNTLVVVTSDHDHLLFGPNSDVSAFQDVSDNGAGNLPGYMWHHNSHSNQLVPAWIRGAGSDLFAGLTDGTDPVRGAYIDQVDIGAGLSLLGPAPMAGDVNLDGDVNGLDIEPFVALLVWSAFQAQADMNGDWGVNGLDIDPFVAALLGSGGVAAVPEPSTLGLAMGGLLSLLCNRSRGGKEGDRSMFSACVI